MAGSWSGWRGLWLGLAVSAVVVGVVGWTGCAGARSAPTADSLRTDYEGPEPPARKDVFDETEATLEHVATPEAFEQAVAGPGPVAVVFYRVTCSKCHAMLGSLNRVAPEFKGRVRFIGVNLGASGDLGRAQGVRGFPTFRVYVGGKLMEDRLGTIYSAPLRDLLNKAVAASEGR